MAVPVAQVEEAGDDLGSVDDSGLNSPANALLAPSGGITIACGNQKEGKTDRELTKSCTRICVCGSDGKITGCDLNNQCGASCWCKAI